jgi:hypothetical protein
VKVVAMETSSGPIEGSYEGSFEPDTTVTDIPAVPAPTEELALLSVSASRDDLGVALAKRPRARVPSLTLLLGALLVAGLGFVGGAMLGKHDASSGGSGLSVAALRSEFAGTGTGASTGTSGRTGSGFGRSGFGSSLFGSGNATIGSVKLVDGSTVYIETTEGSIVQVSTSSSTKVTISSTGTVKDLQPGDEVVVSGTKNASGTVAATSISQSSLGSAGAGG